MLKYLLLSSCLAGCAWGAWNGLSIYYIWSGAGLALLLIPGLVRSYVLSRLLASNDLPACAFNSNGKIVSRNSSFAHLIGSDCVSLMEEIEVISQDPVLIASDRAGRHWKLVYFTLLGVTVVMFIAVHGESHAWIHELPIPCVIIDGADQKVLAINKHLLSYVHEQWEEVPFSQYIAKSRLRDWQNLLDKVRNMGDEMEHLEILWQGANAMPVRLFVRNGESGGFVVMLYDMSDIESIKQQAQKAQNLQILGQLTAGVVHDFNNLLSAISGFCYLLQEHLSADHEASKDVREIQNTAARAQEMTKQLLTLSADTPLNSQLQDPAKVLRECLPTFAMLVGEDVSLSLNLPSGSEEESSKNLVQLTDAQILQVLINLIINAKDAHAKEIKVDLAKESLIRTKQAKTGVLPPGKYITITVTDNGDGIDSSVQGKILESFFSTKPEGSGIGLSTVNRLISLSGGAMDFESSYGSTKFSVYIPLAMNNQSSADRGKRVLLVEDDALVRDMTKRALTYNGYDVTACEDGAAALDCIIGGEEFDLVITDAIMPRMNGIKLIENIKKINTNLPIIFMSGVSSNELRERLPEGVLILTKPIKIKDLIGVISSFIAS